MRLQNNDFVRLLRRLEPRPAWRWHASIVCTRTPIRGAFGFVRDFGCYGPTPKIDPPVPVRPDRRWRILKLLHVVDEHTREAPAIRCERRIDSDATAAVLESP